MGIRKLTVTLDDDNQTIEHDGHKNFSSLEVIGIAEFLRLKGIAPLYEVIEPEEEGGSKSDESETEAQAPTA